jgi:hypothetical protein
MNIGIAGVNRHAGGRWHKSPAKPEIDGAKQAYVGNFSKSFVMYSLNQEDL